MDKRLEEECRCNHLGGEQGLSLIEMVVTVVVLVIVVGGVLSVLWSSFGTFSYGQDTYEAQARAELALRYFDRAFREPSSVVKADPYGTYVVLMTDANNDKQDELLEFFVDYTDHKLKQYVDTTRMSAPSISEMAAYRFDDPSQSLLTSWQKIDIISGVQGTKPTAIQVATLSPNPSDSGRPFIFFGDNPSLSLEYDTTTMKWLGSIKGIRTYMYIDAYVANAPAPYALQSYTRLRNIQ